MREYDTCKHPITLLLDVKGDRLYYDEDLRKRFKTRPHESFRLRFREFDYDTNIATFVFYDFKERTNFICNDFCCISDQFHSICQIRYIRYFTNVTVKMEEVNSRGLTFREEQQETYLLLGGKGPMDINHLKRKKYFS